MIKKTLLTILTVFTISQTAAAANCDSAHEGTALKSFFSNISHWVEVQSPNSSKAATNKPVEFHVNLNNYTESVVYESGEQTGRFLGICSLGQNEIVIRASRGIAKPKITITKLSKRLIRSKFKIAGLVPQIYFYRPNSDVD